VLYEKRSASGTASCSVTYHSVAFGSQSVCALSGWQDTRTNTFYFTKPSISVVSFHVNHQWTQDAVTKTYELGIRKAVTPTLVEIGLVVCGLLHTRPCVVCPVTSHSKPGSRVCVVRTGDRRCYTAKTEASAVPETTTALKRNVTRSVQGASFKVS
jgi:hypothetical protein